jgi:hypothetical protein
VEVVMQKFRVRGVEDLQKAQDGDEFHPDMWYETKYYFPSGWIRANGSWIDMDMERGINLISNETLIRKLGAGVLIQTTERRKWHFFSGFERIEIRRPLDLTGAELGDLLASPRCDTELSCFRREHDGWSFSGRRRYTDAEALELVAPLEPMYSKQIATIWRKQRKGTKQRKPQKFRVKSLGDFERTGGGYKYFPDIDHSTCPVRYCVKLRDKWQNSGWGELSDVELLQRWGPGFVVEEAYQVERLNSDLYDKLEIKDAVELWDSQEGDLLGSTMCSYVCSCFLRVGNGWSFGGRHRYTDEEALYYLEPNRWNGTEPFAAIYRCKQTI